MLRAHLLRHLGEEVFNVVLRQRALAKSRVLLAELFAEAPARVGVGEVREQVARDKDARVQVEDAAQLILRLEGEVEGLAQQVVHQQLLHPLDPSGALGCGEPARIPCRPADAKRVEHLPKKGCVVRRRPWGGGRTERTDGRADRPLPPALWVAPQLVEEDRTKEHVRHDESW